MLAVLIADCIEATLEFECDSKTPSITGYSAAVNSLRRDYQDAPLQGRNSFHSLLKHDDSSSFDVESKVSITFPLSWLSAEFLAPRFGQAR